MRKNELFESGSYPCGDASVLSSSEVLVLSNDLDPSVKFAGEPVMEDLTSSLVGLSLTADPNIPVSFSPIIPTLGAVKKLSVVSTGSGGRSAYRQSNGVIPAPRSLMGECERSTSNSALSVASYLVTQQKFRRDDLYQSNWYRESSSDRIY
ncbi:hypothetical protein AYI68_g5788 [Smittium mucronatum]|uniref:Uncharacterized protein n=1 Tax=Smittium mucronatum TaxID=133383 RepID=A0A1R0GT95_9FUNG|nr:hypothetical protein AYI68_g5788 [Smittium mucronatum]